MNGPSAFAQNRIDEEHKELPHCIPSTQAGESSSELERVRWFGSQPVFGSTIIQMLCLTSPYLVSIVAQSATVLGNRSISRANPEPSSSRFAVPTATTHGA